MDSVAWEALLSELLGRRVSVAYSRARTVPLEVTDSTRGVRIRMHRFFATAPREVGEALAAWIRSGRRARRACALLDSWIDERLAELPAARERRPSLSVRGDTYDLNRLAEPLFEGEFAAEFGNGRRRPDISWGRRGKSRARRCLHLGSYVAAQNLVRIHRVLDQPAVPEWFVRFVLFHEVLHAALAQEGHPPAFRTRERAHPDFRRARRWERDHIAALIRSARRGKPLKGSARRVRAPRQGFLFRF